METDSGVWPGCVADLEGDPAQLEALTVSERLHREVGCGDVAVGDGGPGRVSQLEVAGQEVGVEVGLDDSLDLQVECGRIFEVAADVALRVDDHRSSGGLVSDQVAEDRQARQLVLTEDQRARIAHAAPASAQEGSERTGA
jgi:hypothetical protein